MDRTMHTAHGQSDQRRRTNDEFVLRLWFLLSGKARCVNVNSVIAYEPMPENYFFGPSLKGNSIIRLPAGRADEPPGGQVAPEGHLRKTILST